MSINYRDFIVPFLLVLIFTMTFNYFIGNKLRKESQQTGEARSGERMTVPSTPIQFKPLNKEIDFIDTKSSRTPERITINTPRAKYIFNNDGAILEYFEFNHKVDGKEYPLATILPPAMLIREDRFFLVALNEKTPYYFTLTSQKEEKDSFKIEYQANFNSGSLTKRFTVYKETFKIDLELILEPKSGSEPIQARILLLSPRVPELLETDVITGLVNKLSSVTNIDRITFGSQMFDSAWISPTLFGAEDRYFIHALVSDNQAFAQRGFFKQWNQTGLVAFIEGPAVSTKTEWKLSFYVGPKEDSAISLVDKRLEKTLDYGWFDVICKPFLIFMRFIANYTHNFGLAIILLTLLIRLLLAPFMSRGMENLKKQQEFSKKLQYIQQKYKHDPETLNRERAELIRKHGMPGMSGCLPVLLQIPIAMALYQVLRVSIDLYKAPFLWINDLSAKDPYYILPVLAGLSMFLSSSTSDPKQRISSLVIALLVAAFIANLASGVVLQVVVTTFFSVVQNWVQKRMKAS